MKEVCGCVSRRITSSANTFMTCFLYPKVKPVIVVVVLMDSARVSIIKLNIIGERGQPWSVPLDILKSLDRRPDVYTCDDGQEYRAIIVVNIGPLKSNLASTISIYFQWTLLNAFSASIDSSREGVHVLTAW